MSQKIKAARPTMMTAVTMSLIRKLRRQQQPQPEPWPWRW
ncbi:hypothetical protein SLEP1_g57300 [Rubroshorea leprosula]|uniref:ATP synthase F0 subunit 8 n=1 Tax=Rubroshorea leprosula TaxID=152421 RepID=A0AAV5MM62_9ROSI|nr:hypothetical protein SLEP1_g57300 [Rubroshorea leprosula]